MIQKQITCSIFLSTILLIGCGQQSDDIWLQANNASWAISSTEYVTSDMSPQITVQPASTSNDAAIITSNDENVSTQMHSILYAYTGYAGLGNIAIVDFTDADDNDTTIQTTEEMANAIQTVADTEKYRFGLDITQYSVDSEYIQNHAIEYTASIVMIPIGLNLYTELDSDSQLQDLFASFSENPFEETYQNLMQYVTLQYPDALNADNGQNLQDITFAALVNSGADTLASYPVLDSVTLYDASGNSIDTYTVAQANELQVRGEYDQNAIEASVVQFPVDKSLEINLSELKENTRYRFQDKESDTWDVVIYNDLSKNIILTESNEWAPTKTRFICGLNIDDNTPAFESHGNVAYDITWRYWSDTDKLADYINDSEIIYITDTAPDETIQYPANVQYIYNNTDTTVSVTAGLSDPSVLNAPVYVKQIPAYTIASLSSTNADAFIWTYVN